MAKYKVGDTVRIRSKEWMDTQEKDECGDINITNRSLSMNIDQQIYAGKEARILKVDVDELYLTSADDGKSWWADWMFDYPADPGILSPEEAVRAMLDGVAEVPKDYIGLRRRSVKRKRLMTRWEVLSWADSEASRGWVVRMDGDKDWGQPQSRGYNYDLKNYVRARLLPDLSGVDESTIQGFEVKE